MRLPSLQWPGCRAWLTQGAGSVHQRHVKRLRNRLGDDAARPAWIVNERGVGYRMARPGDPGEP